MQASGTPESARLVDFFDMRNPGGAAYRGPGGCIGFSRWLAVSRRSQATLGFSGEPPYAQSGNLISAATGVREVPDNPEIC